MSAADKTKLDGLGSGGDSAAWEKYDENTLGSAGSALVTMVESSRTEMLIRIAKSGTTEWASMVIPTNEKNIAYVISAPSDSSVKIKVEIINERSLNLVKHKEVSISLTNSNLSATYVLYAR